VITSFHLVFSNMVATREEYAGLPPKKRPRPAASKPSAAASEGGKPAGASGAAAAAKEAGKSVAPAAASKDAGKDRGDKAAADRAASAERKGGGGADKGRTEKAEAKEDARRGGDGGKGPALPPGMGVSRRGEPPSSGSRRTEREKEAGEKEQQPRRGAEDGTPREGPPPGGRLGWLAPGAVAWVHAPGGRHHCGRSSGNPFAAAPTSLQALAACEASSTNHGWLSILLSSPDL
jgi:hypothetical protein